MKRVITIVIVLFVIAAAVFGVFQWRARQNRVTLSSYQTVAAARGDLTSTIGATGIVHSNQTAVLTWQTSGTIGEVGANVGDLVSTEDTLATLERASLAQNVILAQVDLNNARKALEDLKSSQAAQTQALQGLLEAQKAVIETDRALAYFDQDRYQKDLERAEDAVVDAKDALDDAKADFEPYKDLDKDNSSRKRLQDKLDEAQRTYDEAVRKRDLLLLQHEQAKANLAAAKASQADAQREYDRVKDGPNAEDIANAEARITAAQATLNLAHIAAPFAGTITDIQAKPGDRVNPGTIAFQIDDLSRLLVDVSVSEVDINRVKVGQEATLSFDAILGKEYKGVVTRVDRVGSSAQGVVDFVVTVELVDADEDVKPGMTAAVNIVVEKLENVLQVPNRAVRAQSGRRVVYILQNDQLAQVEIKLGASSDTYSQVLEGNLQVGDLIVLNPPLVFETNGPPPFVR
jgi:HlyD family secretion protein